MATTSICDDNAAALAGSPVQRLLLARNLDGGALSADQRMLQELCALAGSDARQHQRRQRWARRSPGRAAAVGWLCHRSEGAPAGRPGRLQEPGKTTVAGDDETVPTAVRWPEDLEARWLRDLEPRWRGEARWLGDLDSNQDCSVQSREFYR